MFGPGVRIAGKYEITEQIGKGSMALVFAGTDGTDNKREVAIKLLRERAAADPELARRFVQEARAASVIGHENIAQVFDTGVTDEGRVFIVMERLRGQTLGAALKEGPFSSERAVSLTLEILAGLSEIHRRGIVHRDLKPANVFLAEVNGVESVKLLDFGISKVLESADRAVVAPGHKPTALGIRVGTPRYMAPEQALCEEVDQRADLWAVGCLLYAMTVGEPAFPGSRDFVISSILQGAFRTPRAALPSISPPVEHVILKAMAMKPGGRFRSADDMASALESATEPTVTSHSVVLAPTAPKGLPWGPIGFAAATLALGVVWWLFG